MKINISGEQPFQVLAHSCIISPSNEDYVLQFSADGITYSDWDETVPAGENCMVVNFAKFTYFKLSGNNSDVIVSY